MVPFLDLPAAYDELRDELDAAWHRVASTGRAVLGPELAAFEEEFATFCGARHAVGVASGLDALHLLLRGHGIGPGDEADRFVIDDSGATVTLKRGASDAALGPYHVDRSKIFVRHRFKQVPGVDEERIARAIEMRCR